MNNEPKFAQIVELDERTDTPVVMAALEFFKVYNSQLLWDIKYQFEGIIRLAEFRIRKLQSSEYAHEDVTEYIAKNQEKIHLAKHRLEKIDKFLKDFYGSL